MEFTKQDLLFIKTALSNKLYAENEEQTALDINSKISVELIEWTIPLTFTDAEKLMIIGTLKAMKWGLSELEPKRELIAKLS